jgi:hypothetical protein
MRILWFAFVLPAIGCFPSSLDLAPDLGLRFGVVRTYEGAARSRQEVAWISGVAVPRRGRSLVGLVEAVDDVSLPEDPFPEQWEVLPGPHKLTVRCFRVTAGGPCSGEGVWSIGVDAAAGEAYRVYIRDTDAGSPELEVEPITNGS